MCTDPYDGTVCKTACIMGRYKHRCYNWTVLHTDPYDWSVLTPTHMIGQYCIPTHIIGHTDPYLDEVSKIIGKKLLELRSNLGWIHSFLADASTHMTQVLSAPIIAARRPPCDTVYKCSVLTKSANNVSKLFFVHHFGLSLQAFHSLLAKHPQYAVEKSWDIFWDTADFKLAKNNLWLRARQLVDTKEATGGGWLLKECRSDSVSGIVEALISDQVDAIVDKLTSQNLLGSNSARRGPLCTDPIVAMKDLHPIASLPFVRILLSKSLDETIYVDVTGIGSECFLIGGIRSTSLEGCTGISSAMIRDLGDGYLSHVRSKVIESIYRRRKSLYEELRRLQYINRDYHDAHVISHPPEGFSLPPNE